MGRGGARRQPDPKSGRSEALGVRFGKLPRGGFTGRRPAWPLTKASAREREVWNEAWKSPQAAAWATEPWRHRTVALWVRWTVKSEAADAPAATAVTALRLQDQIGLTPAGLALNRWEIEEAPNSRQAETPPPTPAATPKPPPAVPVKERLRLMSGGAGGG